jgi:hypothetical protein
MARAQRLSAMLHRDSEAIVQAPVGLPCKQPARPWIATIMLQCSIDLS